VETDCADTKANDVSQRARFAGQGSSAGFAPPKLTAPDLGGIVRKTGNSLAAISNEAAATRSR
jgi:hypothetical protein